MKVRARGSAALLHALLLAVAVTVAGCASGPHAEFVDAGHVYTTAQVDRFAPGKSAGSAAGVTVADAPAVRKTVLTELRRHGERGSQAADFLTKDFPVVTKAVPFYVEHATVDRRPSWIVLEAWGGRTGKLTMRRLWVIDTSSGAVLDARTYR
jgi:hypothetical protein